MQIDFVERKKTLVALATIIRENLDQILNTLEKDLGRHAVESTIAEIIVIQEEIKIFKKNLKKWLKTKKVSTPLPLFPSKSKIVLEPLGRVLVIAPWNYPFHLSLVPAIGALAAGNSVVIKPSELAPHSSKLLAKLINEDLNSPFIIVKEGGKELVEDLLSQKFDKVFFTGSAKKGKMVLQAAAKHLTPVTLELGGKNPLIIAKDFNPKLIKRIVWGKFLNAGQTCLAPDYALVHKDAFSSFLANIDDCITKFYGDNPVESNTLAKIVNQNHFERLKRIIDNNTNKIVLGGLYNENDLKIAPSILKYSINDFDVHDEIFGPILPVIIYENEDNIKQIISKYPNPLTCYIFSDNISLINKLSRDISCGAVSVNECLMHGGNPNLPFGGIGNSGMGKYHGYHSLLCFSNQKTIFLKNNWGDLFLKFPPYTSSKLKWLKKLL